MIRKSALPFFGTENTALTVSGAHAESKNDTFPFPSLLYNFKSALSPKLFSVYNKY